MFKYLMSVVVAVALAVPAFAGNCHVQQQVAFVHAQPVVTYVQPVRQQFVEVRNVQRVVQFQNNHHHNQQQQIVVQKVVNNHHNNVQAVRVQKVVVNQPRVQRSRSVTVVRSR